MNFDVLECMVLDWAHDKGIFEKSDAKTQCLKFLSEAGEVADEVAKGDREALELEMGDVLVTIILLAEMEKLDLRKCLEKAYNKISKRKGEIINGVFVKEGE